MDKYLTRARVGENAASSGQHLVKKAFRTLMVPKLPSFLLLSEDFLSKTITDELREAPRRCWSRSQLFRGTVTGRHPLSLFMLMILISWWIAPIDTHH